MEIDFHAIKRVRGPIFKGVYPHKSLEQSPQTQGEALRPGVDGERNGEKVYISPADYRESGGAS